MSTERKLKEENARLKAEVDALKLGSLLTAVDVLQFIKLKEENERLRKAGDELSWAFAFAVSRDDGKESGLIKAWRAAKEGNQL